ncbi:hypothetical protein MOV76_06980 [Rhizobium sp. PRIMUS64]|uniref:hypothetical protein n=1 Tax=Rhizobium sp. PRIMUS64 TaxID=2908925 RepID=UPI001FF40C4A|nr:hypothetical protein [Rhizobium sp. PRIMUS64]MCJ9691376.1 hypothetical protein [Rhizobium sp. PRIMUS64]
MKMLDFLALGDGGQFTSDDAANLNRDLADKSMSDIPAERRQDVLNYLTNAMLHNSVDHDLRPKIEALIADLER